MTNCSTDFNPSNTKHQNNYASLTLYILHLKGEVYGLLDKVTIISIVKSLLIYQKFHFTTLGY
jgi:hypothetical protein